MTRTEELTRNLKGVRLEIEKACDLVEKDPREISLIAVTKNFPASDIRILYDLGVSDFGESKAQEFAKKYDEVSDIIATWHYIGQVQSNKIREIARMADVVHSISATSHVEKFNQAALANEKVLQLLIQINLDPDYPNDRGGVSEDEAEVLAREIHSLSHVTLGGLMFIASPKVDVKTAFLGFSEVVKGFKSRHPSATVVSAGMSSDISEAVSIGATHLRIGSKLLGNRPL